MSSKGEVLAFLKQSRISLYLIVESVLRTAARLLWTGEMTVKGNSKLGHELALWE